MLMFDCGTLTLDQVDEAVTRSLTAEPMRCLVIVPGDDPAVFARAVRRWSGMPYAAMLTLSVAEPGRLIVVDSRDPAYSQGQILDSCGDPIPPEPIPEPEPEPEPTPVPEPEPDPIPE